MLGKAEVAIVKQTLKKQMKRQKKSYAELATHWGCSEVTAKRAMNKEELSLSRLASLLKWLELEFSDLTLLMEKEKQVCRHTFSEEDENYFDKNPNHLAFFMELYNDEETTEEVAKRYGFNDKELTKILGQLDRMNLIKWQEGFKVNMIHSELPQFIKRGKLQKRYYKNAIKMSSEIFLDRIEKRIFSMVETEDLGGYSFLSFEIHPSTYSEAVKQMRKILSDLESKSRQEKLLYSKEELKSYAIVQGFAPMADSKEYSHFIRDVFGESN